MLDKKSKIFLAPHNDDEALFGAFTIMREKPLVVIVTDSYIQEARGDGVTAFQRRTETEKAMAKLGVDCWFLYLRDTNINKENLKEALNPFLTIMKNVKVVFAPMIEGGNKIHDLVGEVANEMFSNVLYYSTYTKTRPYPLGDIEIEPTETERALKNQALRCYNSQKDHPANKEYFHFAEIGCEYQNSSLYPGKITTLKEQALKNLIDTKEIFDNLKIPFCLMDGTLLGAYRDGDFIAGDYDDVDIGFDNDYFFEAPLMFKGFEKMGFKKIKQFYYKLKFEGGTVVRNGSHIDFFCVHKKGEDAYNLGRNFLPNNSKEYMAYVYPKKCFDKFDKLIFKGMEFNIPSNVEIFLKSRYGIWETPIKRSEGFDWLDQKQNPALKTDYEV